MRTRRLARTLAPLLIASTSFGCAGPLADELAGDAEETEASELGMQAQAQLQTTDTVVINPNVTVTTAPLPINPTITPGTVSVLQVDGGLAPVTQLPSPSKPPVNIGPSAPMGFDVEVPGQLICARTALNGCGTEKADYVGAYQLDTTCDQGFYDMIHGGTCWSCPSDDGRGSPWIRTLDAVDKDTACHREGYARANRVKGRGALAWDCSSGTFWDGWDGGGCWSCPADRPRRTLDAVHTATACATWGLETSPARLLKYNGCPTPDAAKMGLKGKRTPGHAFLDIAGGWNQGVASGGCYACPVTDADGNVVIAERNASPIYGDNQGCDVLFKWKPAPFSDPGLSGIPGVADLLLESGLLNPARLNSELTLLAAGRGLTAGTDAAKSWVAAQWKEIASAPYANSSVRTLVLAQLLLAAQKTEAQRTVAERTALAGFERYLNGRRRHVARMGLQMYDAWKAADDAAKGRMARSTLMVAFDFGTVPFKFQDTLATTMTIGATGAGIAGGLTAALKVANSAKWILDDGAFVPKTGTSLYGLTNSKTFSPLKLLQGTTTANAALAGTAIITVAFAIIQSVAIDQFIEIATARPKLEAALALAEQPVTVQSLMAQAGGSDQIVYWWSKAMETTREIEDGRVVAAVAAAPKSSAATVQVDADAALTVLDATWYLNKYPDLKAAFGSDVQRARTHFLSSGIKEGRDASASFSIGAYLARYVDLQQAFGSNYEAALNHWFTYGKKENRNPHPAGTYMADARAAQLDPVFYANEYPDLKQTFGYKIPLLVQHWLNYGIAEKRIPNAGMKK